MVIRGDECFGWGPHVGSVEEALLSLNLRAAGPLRLLDRLVRPGLYGARLRRVRRGALAEAARPLSGAHPDDAKDLLYFRHRLQGYLGSAAYLKQVVLDHRAPLLDEALLDFNARVPGGAARRQAALLPCRRARPRRISSASRSPCRGNLEDWAQLLASPSPVRRARGGGAHRHAERDLGALRSPGARRDAAAARPAPPGPRPRRGACAGWRGPVLRIAPPLERALVTRSQRAALRVDQVYLRIMVLKTWHDMFVSGDGARGVERRGGA